MIAGTVPVSIIVQYDEMLSNKLIINVVTMGGQQ